MSARRNPIQTARSSCIVFPSGLFSLEKDEVYPYERFAYSLLDVAVEALHHSGLPEEVVVDFTQPLDGSAWSINASLIVDREGNGEPTRFRFFTTQFFPALVYVFVGYVLKGTLVEGGGVHFTQNPNELRERVRTFALAVDAGVVAHRTHGFASAVRACYERLGLTMSDLYRCLNEYDLLTKLIAYHEVGHAYTQHVAFALSRPADRSAIELISDLLATQWFYQKMIANTPDTDEYRELREVATHSDAIFSNALSCSQSQQALLALMAVAGAQRNAGVVTLSGGASHPPGLQRYSLQHLELQTLVRSNFSKLLSELQVKRLDVDWHSRSEALVHSGMIPRPDLEAVLDPTEFDATELAADLIEQFAIEDLRPMAPWLRDIRRQISETANRKP